MKTLFESITLAVKYLFPSRSRQDQRRKGPNVTISRSDACWDEALMAAMYDENARTFLDLMGPRGR